MSASQAPTPPVTAELERPTSPHEPPFMLDDLRHNLQRLSASLPPDGWDPDSSMARVKRQVSGILEFQPTGPDGERSQESNPSSSDNLVLAGGRNREYATLRSAKSDLQLGVGPAARSKRRLARMAFLKRWSCCSCRRKRQANLPNTITPAETLYDHLKDKLKCSWTFRKDSRADTSGSWWTQTSQHIRRRAFALRMQNWMRKA